MWIPEVVTAASGLPVTRSEARWQLQVDDEIPDDVIDGLVRRAASVVERSGSLMERTLGLWLDRADLWRGIAVVDGWHHISLPSPPAASITSVKTWGSDDTETTLASSDRELLSARPSRVPVLRIATDALGDLRAIRSVRVVWTAGYASRDDIPSFLRQAVLEALAMLDREDGTPEWARLRSRASAGGVVV